MGAAGVRAHDGSVEQAVGVPPEVASNGRVPRGEDAAGCLALWALRDDLARVPCPSADQAAHRIQAVRALAWRGTYVVVGFAAGQIPRVPTNLLLLKEATLVGIVPCESLVI